jgi:hypothetical protein
LKLTDESGSAIIEFVVFGLIAQLVLFGFLIKLGVDFRSELAAEALARQSLRSIQLSSSQDIGISMAETVAREFGLSTSDYKINIQDGCPSDVTVRVRVRSNEYVAKGFCLK